MFAFPGQPQAVYQQPQQQLMTVQVPAGLGPGATFAMNTASGPMQVTVPHGLVPNAGGVYVMQVQVPVAAQPQVMMVQSPPVVVQSPAPQPQVMQQSPPPAPKSAPGTGGAEAARIRGQAQMKPRGPAGEIIYTFNVSTCGPDFEGLCGAGASPLMQLLGNNETRAEPPPELKNVISDASWELTIEKLAGWQRQVGPCPVPCCEATCWATGFCCCACSLCACTQYADRKRWEATAAEEVNGMLEQYHVKVAFKNTSSYGECCLDQNLSPPGNGNVVEFVYA